MPEFRLSTLDQNAPRTYLRYAICFDSNTSESNIITERLQRAARSLVSEVPMLAGVVTVNDQQKATSVTVTPNQVKEFAAIVRHLKDQTESYQDMCHGGIAPRHIGGIDDPPLANDPEETQSPSCAILENFINGGLVLVSYLHHAVADTNGVGTIMRLMSEGLPPRKLNRDALKLEAKAVSQARSRLSQSSGDPAFLSLARDINQRLEQSRQPQQQRPHPGNGDNTTTENADGRPTTPSNRSVIFSFKLDILVQTTEMLNSRRTLGNNSNNPNSTTALPNQDNLTPREVLISILWRAYARAKYPFNPKNPPTPNQPPNSTFNNTSKTSLSFPLNLRPIPNPPLAPYWLGNASTPVFANEEITSLTMPYNLSTLERTAAVVHNSAQAQSSDVLARSRIPGLNGEGVGLGG